MELKDIARMAEEVEPGDIIEFVHFAKQCADSEQGQQLLHEVMGIVANTIKPMIEAVTDFGTNENIRAYNQYVAAGIAPEHAVTLLASRNMQQTSGIPVRIKK